ncbi:hypothetical protein AAFF_G00180290 [Aldrovandia affinis]|uniref:Uncharacterized protein n=1 Tax=Aldrovandia affinis TaxID=143900 RepID=A0AAD7SY97_9TELE|nr:hypothetical protein AAFF_G00180290 [Aldrovandia affinis]
MYSERVKLQNLNDMQVDSSSPRTTLSVYTLALLNEEVQINDPNEAEEWRGFIIIVRCFYSVSPWQEAEQMLAENPECGSIILRLPTVNNSCAVTMTQILPSLQAVLDHFPGKTEHSVQPYIQGQHYDTRMVVPAKMAAQTANSALPFPAHLPWPSVPSPN